MVAQYDLENKLKSKKRTIKDLAEYIKINPGTTPNYSLFLGAGASVTSGIRTASNLVEEWREEVYERLSSTKYPGKEEAVEWFTKNHTDWFEPSNEYSSLFEMKFDLASQRRRFVEIQVDKKLPSIGYAYLVELFETKYFDTVFTTNFDDLINEAFYQFSSNRPLLCAHDSSIKGVSISSARPKVIKLHGDYLFDSIKSSLRETENLEANTREKLVDFAKEYGIIFVGYAGNDNSIMEVLKFLLKQEDYLKNGIYWCRRAGDDFSPEVIKLLNNERVYWVEIDGFDEFMAELTHELGIELSLGGNNKSTKREKMINNFIADKYKLTNNDVICSDVKKLKKHVYTQDLSSLINELSSEEFDDSKIPESEFKKLLSVDSLIRSKSYEQAETEIIKHLATEPTEVIYVKYVQRLIETYSERSDFKKALEYSEKLIAIDPNNVTYHTTRADLLKKPKEKVSYLRECLDKFKYSFSLRNFLAESAADFLNNKDAEESTDVTYNEVLKWLNESLNLDGSLDNKAWYIMYDAIIDQYAPSLDKNKERVDLQDHLNKMASINPEHENFLTLKTKFLETKNDLKELLDFAEELHDIYITSSKRKQKYILNNLSKIFMHLNELYQTEDFEYKKISNSFIDKYDSDASGDTIASYLVFKATYQIGQYKNIQDGIALAKRALDSKWRGSHLSAIFNIMLIDKNNISILRETVNAPNSDLYIAAVAKANADLYVAEGDFDNAISVIDEAYSTGHLNLAEHMLSKSYIQLKAKRYSDAISFIDSKILGVKDIHKKDILIINREVAKKALGLELKENEIRTVISHRQSKGLESMCAFFLLDDLTPARKLLRSAIERDYLNYFLIKEWPAVPLQELSEFTSLEIVA